MTLLCKCPENEKYTQLIYLQHTRSRDFIKLLFSNRWYSRSICRHYMAYMSGVGEGGLSIEGFGLGEDLRL